MHQVRLMRSSASELGLKSVFHFTSPLAKYFHNDIIFLQLSTNEDGKRLCHRHRRNVSLAASEMVKWKTDFRSTTENLDDGVTETKYYFMQNRENKIIFSPKAGNLNTVHVLDQYNASLDIFTFLGRCAEFKLF